jgi:hypothetical protein
VTTRTLRKTHRSARGANRPPIPSCLSVRSRTPSDDYFTADQHACYHALNISIGHKREESPKDMMKDLRGRKGVIPIPVST